MDKSVSLQVCDLGLGSGKIAYPGLSIVDLEDYKMVKVPFGVYKNLYRAKLQRERKGVLNPEIVSPEGCLNCKKVDEVRESKI